MVGRLSTEDTETVAKVVLALSQNNKKEAARLYRDGGYRATWREGAIVDDAILHRFATIHLDKFDLSPITMEGGDKVDTISLFRSLRERAVPIWISEAARLGGLLMGVSAQAARPISLSKEWAPIAAQTLENKKRRR